MSRETSLIKKIVALNEDDVSHDSYMLTVLCDIADSLAVIADKLTDEKGMSNEVLHKLKNGSNYPAKIMVEGREYIPVVRCKECIHNGSIDTDCPFGWKDKKFNMPKPNDYCSYGER